MKTKKCRFCKHSVIDNWNPRPLLRCRLKFCFGRPMACSQVKDSECYYEES